MKNRKILLAANWKMNKSLAEVKDFFTEINNLFVKSDNVNALICPTSVYLRDSISMTNDNEIAIGSQDVSIYKNGAFTGDVSSEMLKSVNVKYCITGHSERREYYKESNKIINEKIKRLREESIIPILCIGESLQQREAGNFFSVLEKQLNECLEKIEITENYPLVIAYEPIWAIGTGKTASPEQAQEVHKFIREWLKNNYSDNVSNKVQILYGGSVKPQNIKDLLAKEDIDGGLIGGAALKVYSYMEMYSIAKEMSNQEKL